MPEKIADVDGLLELLEKYLDAPEAELADAFQSSGKCSSINAAIAALESGSVSSATSLCYGLV